MGKRINLILLVLVFNLTSHVIQGHQTSLCKSGSMQLPNSEKLNGYVWMPGSLTDSAASSTSERILRVFRSGMTSALISFEYERRQFISLKIPFRGGNYQRITELHFEGAITHFYRQKMERIKYFT